MTTTITQPAKMRLDKWLWAARFFKTRALAKQAIEGGKIQVDGHRAKPSKEIHVGIELAITRGWETITVVITAIAEHRRGATEAAALYKETSESQLLREQQQVERRTIREAYQPPKEKPSKKQRRHIHRFIENNH